MRASELREQVAQWEAERDRIDKLLKPAQQLLAAMEAASSSSKRSYRPRSSVSPDQRWASIKSALREHGEMKASEIAKEVHSTPGTIRNDIQSHSSELIISGEGSPGSPYTYKLREQHSFG